MKFLLTLILIISLFSVCYADRVCLEKSTGKLIEYQSGNVNDLMFDGTLPSEEIKKQRLNSLKQNALNMGYKEIDIEVKEITKEEWKIIEYEQLIKPVQDKTKQKELAKKQKQDAIKTKLKLAIPTLTDEDLEELLND